MRKFSYTMLMILVFGFLQVSQVARAENSPFNFETNKRFNKVEQMKTMKFFYDTANLSADVATVKNIFGQLAILPAGADVIASWFYINKAFAGEALIKEAVSCGSANMLSATAVQAYSVNSGFEGTIARSTAFGSAAAGLVGSSDCQIKVTNSAGVPTAGQFYGWVQYVIPVPTNSNQYQY